RRSERDREKWKSLIEVKKEELKETSDGEKFDTQSIERLQHKIHRTRQFYKTVRKSKIQLKLSLHVLQQMRAKMLPEVLNNLSQRTNAFLQVFETMPVKVTYDVDGKR